MSGSITFLRATSDTKTTGSSGRGSSSEIGQNHWPADSATLYGTNRLVLRTQQSDPPPRWSVLEMNMEIPELSLVVLIGPSGSGKSTFARKHFLSTEVLSSDACRGMVSDDENNQSGTNEAFALLHFIVAQPLALGRPAVIVDTHRQPARP